MFLTDVNHEGRNDEKRFRRGFGVTSLEIEGSSANDGGSYLACKNIVSLLCASCICRAYDTPPPLASPLK